MKKWLAVVTMGVVGLMPAVATAHHGTGSHEDNGNEDDGGGGQSQQQNATGGAGGQGGNSNQSQGQGQKQKQGQAQGQAQGQGQSQQTKQANTQNLDASQDTPRQAPSAHAPNLVAAPETCMGSTAIGASTPFGGVAIGTTYKSEDCELRMFARSLSALGQNDAALALLAQNPKVAAALRTVGAKLSWLQQEKDQTPVVVVAVGETSTPSQAPEGP